MQILFWVPIFWGQGRKHYTPLKIRKDCTDFTATSFAFISYPFSSFLQLLGHKWWSLLSRLSWETDSKAVQPDLQCQLTDSLYASVRCFSNWCKINSQILQTLCKHLTFFLLDIQQKQFLHFGISVCIWDMKKYAHFQFCSFCLIQLISTKLMSKLIRLHDIQFKFKPVCFYVGWGRKRIPTVNINA